MGFRWRQTEAIEEEALSDDALALKLSMQIDQLAGELREKARQLRETMEEQQA